MHYLELPTLYKLDMAMEGCMRNGILSAARALLITHFLLVDPIGHCVLEHTNVSNTPCMQQERPIYAQQN